MDRIPDPIRLVEGEDGRLTEATESFRKSNQILFGSLQLSFFETSPGAWMAEPLQEKP